METIVAAAVSASAVACAVWIVSRPRIRAGTGGIWPLLARLPPVEERSKPWLAALLAFVFGGIGVVLSFRKAPDLALGILFVLALGLASSGGPTADSALAWWYWIVAGVAGLYALFRSESANRRLDAAAAEEESTPALAP